MLRNLRPLLFSILLCATSAAAQQPPAPRVVDLTAPDGLKLKATFFAAASPGPGMLLLHQCNRQRNVWDDLAARMASAGLNVMTLDLRGYGDSEGTRVDKLTPEEAKRLIDEYQAMRGKGGGRTSGPQKTELQDKNAADLYADPNLKPPAELGSSYDQYSLQRARSAQKQPQK